MQFTYRLHIHLQTAKRDNNEENINEEKSAHDGEHMDTQQSSTDPSSNQGQADSNTHQQLEAGQREAVDQPRM